MVTSSRVVSLSAVLVGLASIGCGGAGGAGAFKAEQPFPTREKLAAVAAAPAKPLPPRAVTSAPSWTVDPKTVAAGPLDAKLSQATNNTVRLSNELRCVASQTARFVAERGAMPDERLERFLGGACGLTSALYETHAFLGDFGKIPDEDIIAEWAKRNDAQPYKNARAGVALARKGEKGVIVSVIAKDDPSTAATVLPADDEGIVTVKGTAPPNAAALLGLVNRGAGVATCEADTSVPLPAYVFRCALAKDDKNAWVEITWQPEGRLLSRELALALARRDPSATIDYVDGATAAKGASGDAVAMLLDGVNRARASVGARPVALAQKQTTTNTGLAPHFFHAEIAADQDKGETVALGLMAGWDVEGVIRDGNLFASLLSGSDDPNAWLAHALDTPLGRHTMLAPSVKQMAIGVAKKEHVGGVGAVVTSYEFFGDEDPAEDAKRVLLRLQRARIAKGQAKPIPIAGLVHMKTEAALVKAGTKEVMQALSDGLTGERDRTGVPVKGWVVGTNDLDSMILPPELVNAPSLQVGIEVTHYRPEGAAWGMYVVFFLVPTKETQVTARPRIIGMPMIL